MSDLRRRDGISKAKGCRWWCWPAPNTAPAAAAIGPPRERFCSGVRAVLAVSFERIHRSNLVGMGVLPLELPDGKTWQRLGLTGEETFDIVGLDDSLQPAAQLTVRAKAADGTVEGVRLPGADRHAGRAGLLPQRRHPADRAAEDARLRTAQSPRLAAAFSARWVLVSI